VVVGWTDKERAAHTLGFFLSHGTVMQAERVETNEVNFWAGNLKREFPRVG